MSLNTWRQFQLYENIPIRDPFTESDQPLYSDPTLTAVASLNETYLAIAVQASVVKVVDLHDMTLQFEFEAYTSEYQLTYLERVSDTLIVSVGECLGKPVLIKLWDLEKMPKDESKYHALAEVRNGSNAYPVSTVSCNLDASCIAVGFTDGRVILVRGDLLRDRGSKYRIIYEDSNKEPITALSLSNDGSRLFVTTTNKIMLFNTSGRNNGKPDMILNDSEGVDLNCGVLNRSTDEFICALKDKLDIYMGSGSKRSLIVDIPTAKRIFPISADHILVLVSNITTSSLHLGKTPNETIRAVILDIKTKIISYSLLITSSVIDIFSDGASVNLLTSNGVIHKLRQKKLDDQLNTICQKDMYSVALELAKQHSLPDVKVQEIKKSYGDYLFKKGSKREAIEQYMGCIEVCDPTEIISKFGVEHKTNSEDSINLKDFLWKLVKDGKAKVDHITLLLTLLIKLHDIEGLGSFLSHFKRDGVFNENPEEFGNWSMNDDSFFYSDSSLFDLDIALRLLLECNMLELAQKYVLKYSKDPSQVVSIVLLHKKDSFGALNYIKSLPVDDALRVLIKFSRKLLDLIPNETNLLLIDLFIGQYKPSNYDAVKENVVNQKKQSEPADKEPIIFYNYRSFFEYMLPSSASSDDKPLTVESAQPTYHPPKPSLIFPSFVQKPFQFVVFLEACLESYKRFQGYDQDRQDILTTLYDIYLSLYEDDIEERKAEWKGKAEAVLEETEKYKIRQASERAPDSSLMLLISHMHDMNPFTLSSMQEDEQESNSIISHVSLSDVFRSMCLTNDPHVCLSFLEKYGESEHDLYKIAMPFFVSSKQIYEDIGGESVFREKILNKVLKFDLMSPLEIIQTLSGTNVVKYGAIKDFLVDYLKGENAEIQKNELLVKSYEKELDLKVSKLKEALAIESPLQVQVKKRLCDACNILLEFPMVFFKCGHLYHQRCLNEETDSDLLYSCPQCVVETESAKKTMATYKNSSQNANLLRAALSDLDAKEDRFAIISEFIGKGGLDDPECIITQG
ncbi:tethering complex subunit PEP5 [Kluyveromyces lactis]|uniref:E3 ubiquitin-protein ligase PEP5 n=1 Tax=Kluyveromyces lactis (strain ATCC 8585 / CBS 2359 / DSM 70799 / NBRC 1267 / NRRL Y-1140 / WM37) TaxID=284590 RepID=Q6CVC5_KLULA|nr:uncharacterized protein KLLA0_B13090g [Kluyveromyces lactis]CAH02507.1 KLLA0B13090p [Kluyveromyces lactis]|eukprot:XP_452114.1 uncharacterized protein KLLA0_B13090g [Kluyveromyces lactis]